MTIKIEYIKISDIKTYAQNARTHSDEQVNQLVKSITEFGFTNPILIDENSELIAGHGRTMAAKELGLDKLPAIRLKGLSPEKVKALRLADNQLALNSGWDADLLALEIEALNDAGYDLELIGFDDEELDKLLNEASLVEAPVRQQYEESEKERSENTAAVYDEDEDGEIIEPPTAPTAKLGNIWSMGQHRLMCGDSTSAEELTKLMDGHKADLWLTDPPYNIAYEGKTEEALTIQNDSMSDDDFRKFLTDCYKAADENMKPGATFYIWHADSEGYNFRGAARDIGWKIRQCLIWNKNTLVLSRQDYHWKHEPCLYGWKDGAAHNWYSDRKQTTILEFNKPQRNGEHPTMKPVDLFEYQIQNSTTTNNLVLDSFGGSGTTLIACEKTNRRACIMELDPKYCDVIINRWESMTGKKAVLLSE